MSQYTLDDFSSSGVECPTCGETYKSEHGVKVHHKRVHGESLAGEEFECDWCGSTETKDPSKIHDDMNNFCSMECRGKYRSENYTGENSSRWDGGTVTLTCEACGEDYERYPSRVGESRYCSSECRSEGLSERFQGEDGPNYRGGKVTVACENCSTGMELYPSDAEYKRFCSMECRDEWHSKHFNGQDHPNWRGGKSVYDAVKRQLGNRSWPAIREEYRSDECEACGTSEGLLDLHHIVPVMAGGTNEPWNLMTLCRSCHFQAEWFTRDLLDPVLTEE